jgi:glycosyltransferase involved in cell wall biosynthesis
MMIKKALIHDWFTVNAGAEKCVRSFVNIWPESDVFSLIDFLSSSDRDKILMGKRVKTSFIQKVPFIKKNYRKFLPLFTFAIEQLDVSSYDVVLSSSHCVAKGVITNPNQLHVCYMHTPVRYAWDLHDQYLQDSGLDKGIKGILAKYFLRRLRRWDINTIDRVDYYIANSIYVSKRIEKIYAKDSHVIYPPVDTDAFKLKEKKEDFYLAASRLVSYKKIDLIVKSFVKNKKKLVVIGDGPEMQNIMNLAKSNISVLGYQDNHTLIDHMQRAKAFVFAAEEDFGIIPVEAQACGTPVICLSKGGTKETVIDGLTGIHFDNQTEEDVINAINKFEVNYANFDPVVIRNHALQFGSERFEREIKEFVEKKYNNFRKQ